MTQVIEGCRIPGEYEVWADGVYKIDFRRMAQLRNDGVTVDIAASLDDTPPDDRRPAMVKIVETPMWCQGYGQVADPEERFSSLTYRDQFKGGFKSKWIDRHSTSSEHRLVKLASSDLPVNSVNARNVIKYLSCLEAANGEHLNHTSLGYRTGHYEIDGKCGYLLGAQWIGPSDMRFDVVADRLHKFNEALRPHGFLRPWVDMFRKVIATGPVTRWLTCSVFTAPILWIIPYRSFVIHHYCGTGAGKSALADFNHTTWGSMDSRLSFNATQLGLTESFAVMTDICVTFDELQAAGFKDNEKALNEFVHRVALQQSRMRSGRQGGLQTAGLRWNNIVRTTGEQPIVHDNSIDTGGVGNRVLQIEDPGVGELMARKLHGFKDRHYGLAGPVYLDYVTRLYNANGPNLFRDKYHEATEFLHSEIGQFDQLSLALGACVVGQSLALPLFTELSPDLAWECALQDAVEVAKHLHVGQRITYREKVINFLKDHRLSARQKYVDIRKEVETTDGGWRDNSAEIRRFESGYYRDAVGFRTETEMWYVPSAIKEVLSRQGFNPPRVWRELRESGHLRTTEPRKNTVVRRRGTYVKRFYAVGKPSSP